MGFPTEYNMNDSPAIIFNRDYTLNRIYMQGIESLIKRIHTTDGNLIACVAK